MFYFSAHNQRTFISSILQCKPSLQALNDGPALGISEFSFAFNMCTILPSYKYQVSTIAVTRQTNTTSQQTFYYTTTTLRMQQYTTNQLKTWRSLHRLIRDNFKPLLKIRAEIWCQNVLLSCCDSSHGNYGLLVYIKNLCFSSL